MTHDYDEACKIFRGKVLAAMDAAMLEIIGDGETQPDCGATDADLPEIFNALDAQLVRAAKRHGHPLHDGEDYRA